MFGEYLDTFDQQRKECTVYSSAPETDLGKRLATRNVSVTHRRLPPGGPEPYVTIRENRDTIGAVSVHQLEQLLSPPADSSLNIESLETGVSGAFELFDETLFRSLDRRQLLLASREIEDRAFRVGSGTLRAQFQTEQSFAPQEALYRRLAADTDLAIHIYSAGNWTPPAIDGIEFHSGEGQALDSFWCLAFDGGPEAEQACVLLAREHETGYEGFWSYDPELVTEIIEAFTALD